MSALSIPPSQKTNISAGLESIHNYANVINPVALFGADQYSVVAVYTEVEVGASDVDEQLIESAEVQVQTDFYEEEIVAVGTDNMGSEETSSARAEETSDAVDVAKALETLTKTFALRKERLGQDVLTGKNNDSSLKDEAGSGNVIDEGKTSEGHETNEQSDDKIETDVEELKDDFQNGDISSSINSSNFKSFPVHEDVSVPETQQSASSDNIRRSFRLQVKTSPGWQETCKFKRVKDMTEEPKKYKNICIAACSLMICVSFIP